MLPLSLGEHRKQADCAGSLAVPRGGQCAEEGGEARGGGGALPARCRAAVPESSRLSGRPHHGGQVSTMIVIIRIIIIISIYLISFGL